MNAVSFKDLSFWQKSMILAKEIYLLTEKFPKQETYGLSSQMRRAAVSIPSNIAEGKQRNNTREYIQFLGITYGSAAELETQLILASDIFGEKEKFDPALALVVQIQKMLNTAISTLRFKSGSRPLSPDP